MDKISPPSNSPEQDVFADLEMLESGTNENLIVVKDSIISDLFPMDVDTSTTVHGKEEKMDEEPLFVSQHDETDCRDEVMHEDQAVPDVEVVNDAENMGEINAPENDCILSSGNDDENKRNDEASTDVTHEMNADSVHGTPKMDCTKAAEIASKDGDEVVDECGIMEQSVQNPESFHGNHVEIENIQTSEVMTESTKKRLSSKTMEPAIRNSDEQIRLFQRRTSQQAAALQRSHNRDRLEDSDEDVPTEESDGQDEIPSDSEYQDPASEKAPGYEKRQEKRKQAIRQKARKNGVREIVSKNLAVQAKKKQEKKRAKGKGAPKKAKKKTDSTLTATRAELTMREETANKMVRMFMKDIPNMTFDILGDHDNSDINAEPDFNRETELVTTRKQALDKLLKDVPKNQLHKARTQKANLDRACKMFPRGIIKPNGVGRWGLKGMITSLHNHQLIGAAWMAALEVDSDKKGGILADEMGFGKTVQSFALMVGNQLDRQPKAPTDTAQATLVVCPSSLARQWYQEAGKHLQPEHNTKVFLHVPGHRIECRGSQEILSEALCVITTYDEVRLSMKDAMLPNELVEDHEIDDFYANQGQQSLGILHSIRWSRIILDECTAIKNYKCATAQACCLLEANCRWLLSGTPLINNVDEMYSYLTFLRMSLFAGSRDHFISNFVETQKSMDRMQQLIRMVMLRRTHKSRLFGKEIVRLPPSYREICYVELSKLERVIYDICCERFCFYINDQMRKQHEMNLSANRRERKPIKMRHIFDVMLRLRQIAAHPLTAGETIKKLLLKEDRERIRAVMSEIDSGSPEYETVIVLRQYLLEADAIAHGQPVHEGTEKAKHIDNGSTFGREQISGDAFLNILENFEETGMEEEPCCVVCGVIPGPPNGVPVEANCGHLYCEPCLESWQEDCAADGMLETICCQCNKVIDGKQLILKDWQSPSLQKKGRETYRENMDFSWITKGESLMPSTKLTAVKAQVSVWLAADDETKIIVYTQFVPILKCLKRLCRAEGWRFATYFGEMNMLQREKAIKDFRENKETRILLATLRSGGLGLNLNCANRIINLDPWWNFAVENQAFGRIYRIGQERETTMVRVIAKDTIDERLLEMQSRKLIAINKALNEGGESKPLLSRMELLSLFGQVGHGEDSVPYVIPNTQRDNYRGGERKEPLNFQESTGRQPTERVEDDSESGSSDLIDDGFEY